jgi:hypothetical protein
MHIGSKFTGTQEFTSSLTLEIVIPSLLGPRIEAFLPIFGVHVASLSRNAWAAAVEVLQDVMERTFHNPPSA